MKTIIAQFCAKSMFTSKKSYGNGILGDVWYHYIVNNMLNMIN